MGSPKGSMLMEMGLGVEPWAATANQAVFWFCIAAWHITIKLSGLKQLFIIIILILRVRNLDRAQKGCFIPVPPCLGPQLGGLKWLGLGWGLAGPLSLFFFSLSTQSLHMASLRAPTIWRLPRGQTNRWWLRAPRDQGRSCKSSYRTGMVPFSPFLMGQSQPRVGRRGGTPPLYGRSAGVFAASYILPHPDWESLRKTYPDFISQQNLGRDSISSH